MADPLDAAAAVAVCTNDNNVDDVDDLYADLDEQVAAALAAAGESGGSNARDSDRVSDGEGEVPEADANEALDLGDGTEGYSSSDEESDDGLRIVLNQDTSAPLPSPPVGRGEGCVAEVEEGDDTGNRVKGSSDWATVGGLQCKGLIEKTTLPIMGQIDRGHQHVFQRDYNFSLPRNGTIFDIDIEAFQQKPWRRQGVDITDYFNFSLDEEDWRKYWCSMKQLRLGARSLVNETSGLEQESYKQKSVKAMSKIANDSGFEGRNGLGKPKGRAIHVEGSACERVPSADLWHPVQRDSDVVIQVNMTLSPSNQSTLNDSSKLNHKGLATERVVDKEVDDGGSSEGVRSKLDRRDSYFARDQSLSPDYSDMLSGESKENLYFKRSNRHSDFRDFEDTKLQDEHVKSDFYCYSSKSDRENSESCSRGYNPGADDRNMESKLLQRGEAPFAGRGKSSDLFVGCNSDRDLKSRYKARKGQRRQSLDDGRNALFVEKEKPTDSYPSRYDRTYEKRRSSSSSLRTNYRNSVWNQSYEQLYSPLERIALKNDEHYFSDDSNYHHRQSLSCDISEGEDVDECFSSAKEWQRYRDHIYHSVVKTDMPDADDGRMHRERYGQEKRRGRHDHSVDVEFSHYTDYRFCEWQSPEVRGRYRDKGKFAKSNDGHFRQANHLEMYPGLNNSERDRPATAFPFMSSINRCIDSKSVRNAKMTQNNCHGHHQKSKQHDSSFCIGNIPRSALSFGETGRFVLPIKRKLHSDLGSVDQNTLADLPLLKGRRLMHGQSIVSDRRIYALKLHKSTEKNNTEATCSSSDMRNSNTVSNICVGRRHELDNADNIHLNDRKIKFERQGNELRRVIENNQKGPHPVDEDLHASRHKHVHQKLRKQDMGHHDSGNQDLEKSADQNRLNEDVEIEEGELIEEDHHDIISRSKRRPRNAVLKSVIETCSADQLLVNSTTLKDAAFNNRATRECDEKHILEVMEKMQKRRERFKEAIAPKKEDADKKDVSALGCSTDYIQNQRPARKRRWGGNSRVLEMP